MSDRTYGGVRATLDQIERVCAVGGGHWQSRTVRDLAAHIRELEAENARLRKRLDDSTAFCSGEFPCEASTHAAEYQDRAEAAERRATERDGWITRLHDYLLRAGAHVDPEITYDCLFDGVIELRMAANEAIDESKKAERRVEELEQIERNLVERQDYWTRRVESAERMAADLKQEVRKWRRIRTPTHGSCCTCQECGQLHEDCRCDLDEVADESARLKEALATVRKQRDTLAEALRTIRYSGYGLNHKLMDAHAEQPPSWARDEFNDDEAARCGYCGAWCTVVRPGKTQCDYCGDGQPAALAELALAALDAEETKP